MFHKITNFAVLGAIAVGLPVVFLGAPARADGETGARHSVFVHSPHLIRSAVSNAAVYTPASYEFTVQVPENAGAPLQALRIIQEPNSETIGFDLTQNRAFEGDSFAGGPSVSLAAIGGAMPPSQANEVTVVFDPPVVPGKTVTVTLESPRNPSLSNVYLFGVTAYPAGDNSPGLFLGYGRINLEGH
jgi:Protein of unknown function (DUF2808)